MLHLLECSLTLDKYRNFARAAEHLGISQPTLTRSIQELERQLGVKLFDRGRRGVEPTEFGALVLESARRVALDIAEVKRTISLLNGLNLGELAIGVGPVVAQTWLGEAVGRLLAQHPKLQPRILDLDWWDIPAALHERRVDLAIGEAPDAKENPEIVVEPLPHRQASFYCRTGHPLQKIKKPSIREIGEYPFVAPRMPKRASEFLSNGGSMGELAECGQYFNPRIQCQNMDACMHVVKASNAVGIATTAKIAAAIASGDIAMIPFHASWMQTNYAIMHLRERTLAPAALAFCVEAREAERRYNEASTPPPSNKKRTRR